MMLKDQTLGESAKESLVTRNDMEYHEKTNTSEMVQKKSRNQIGAAPVLNYI